MNPTQAFDPKKPVYVIKSFFYGNTNSSIRHASDHPLRLEQVPPSKRTPEFIKQGRVRSNIPTMIVNEETGGIEIDEEAEKKEDSNPLEQEEVKDEKGETLPSSAPKSQRAAAKKKNREQSKSTDK